MSIENKRLCKIYDANDCEICGPAERGTETTASGKKTNESIILVSLVRNFAVRGLYRSKAETETLK